MREPCEKIDVPAWRRVGGKSPPSLWDISPTQARVESFKIGLAMGAAPRGRFNRGDLVGEDPFRQGCLVVRLCTAANPCSGEEPFCLRVKAESK
jgi:hypothetical protein